MTDCEINMNSTDTQNKFGVPGGCMKVLSSMSIVVLVVGGCWKVDRVSDIWEAVASPKLPEAGITQWTIYRKSGFSRERVDDLVARYRGYGDCIVYERITSDDEYRVACESSGPVVVLKGQGEWEFGNVGLTQQGRLVTRDSEMFREQLTVSVRALRDAARQGARSGRAAITVMLIPVEPDDLLPGGETPLVLAVLTRDAAAVKALIASGANPNQPDEERRYPVVLAASMGSAEITSLLLESGSRLDVTVNGIGPVTAAADRGHLEVIRLLVMSGRVAPADLMVARSHARDRPEILGLLAGTPRD